MKSSSEKWSEQTYIHFLDVWVLSFKLSIHNFLLILSSGILAKEKSMLKFQWTKYYIPCDAYGANICCWFVICLLTDAWISHCLYCRFFCKPHSDSPFFSSFNRKFNCPTQFPHQRSPNNSITRQFRFTQECKNIAAMLKCTVYNTTLSSLDHKFPFLNLVLSISVVLERNYCYDICD